MATADIVIAGVIALSAVFGLMRGLIREVVSLAVWITAALGSMAFAGVVADTALKSLDLGRPARVAIGFALVFIGVVIAGALVQRVLAGLVKSSGLDGTDRMLGLVFGGLRGAVVVIIGLLAVRPFAEQSPWWAQSELRPGLLAFEDELLRLLGVAQDAVDGGEDAGVRGDGGARVAGPAARRHA